MPRLPPPGTNILILNIFSQPHMSELVCKVRDFAVLLLCGILFRDAFVRDLTLWPLASSRLPNLVVRLSLAQQPGSRQESETRNERRILGVAESCSATLSKGERRILRMRSECWNAPTDG